MIKFIWVTLLLFGVLVSAQTSPSDGLVPREKFIEYFRSSKDQKYVNFIGVTDEEKLCELSVSFIEKNILVEFQGSGGNSTSPILDGDTYQNLVVGNITYGATSSISTIPGSMTQASFDATVTYKTPISVLFWSSGPNGFERLMVKSKATTLKVSKDNYGKYGRIAETLNGTDDAGKEKSMVVGSCNLRTRQTFVKKSADRFIINLAGVEESY
jgi:hypothetical protein